MTKIITLHSAHRGTGKTNITANLAVLIANEGYRVGVIDTDILAPGLHAVFGFNEADLDHALNDFIWTHFSIDDLIEQVVLPLSFGAGSLVPMSGNLFLVPASVRVGDITRALYEGLDPQRLMTALQELIVRLKLDYLLIDTQPGFHNEALLLMAVADAVLLVLRPQKQDFLDTAVLTDLARQLGVPQLIPIVNLAPTNLDIHDLDSQLHEVYAAATTVVLSFSEEMAQLGSRGLLCVESPDCLLVTQLRSLAAALIAESSVLPAVGDRFSAPWILEKREAIAGLVLPDLLDMAEPEQRVVKWLMRHPKAFTLTELASQLEQVEVEIIPILQGLVERGIVYTIETKPLPRYQIHLSRRRPHTIPDIFETSS